MYTTMDQIQQLSTERYELWLKAGRQELSDAEYWHLQQIDHRLENLWGKYRREYAAATRNRRAFDPPAVPVEHQALEQVA